MVLVATGTVTCVVVVWGGKRKQNSTVRCARRLQVEGRVGQERETELTAGPMVRVVVTVGAR